MIHRKPPPRSLEELTREAKSSLKPSSIDWEKVEGGLYSRIEATRESGMRASTTSRLRHLEGTPERRWQVAGLVAAAAVMVLALHKTETTSSSSSRAAHARATTHEDVLTLTKDVADVRVDGELAAPGRTLRVLDTLETSDDAAELAATSDSSGQASALRVAWQLGEHSTALVKSLGHGTSPFVLGLNAGSIEAQVTPVERGEAFAVDLRSPHASGPHDVVRVAVHGTHLRVARDVSGDHATIDLTEGVVSIGFPPKVGSTYGTLVTAPAHVDIDVTKLIATGDLSSGAIVVDKGPAAIRAPLVLAGPDDGATKVAAVATPEITNAPVATSDHPEVDRPPSTERALAQLDPHATEAIRAAAQSCAVVHASTDVKVTVSSKLTLHVGADGLVKIATFDPPLSPEAQDCAAKTIYRTRFDTGAARDVSVNVDVNP